MVNYGVLYGMSDFGLAERTGLPSADASGFIQRYFERFGTVKAFQDDVIRKAEDVGYAETLLGRRRYLPEIRSHLFAVRIGGDSRRRSTRRSRARPATSSRWR